MKSLSFSLRASEGSDSSRPAWRREMVWMMREYGPESFALEFLLDDLEEKMARSDGNVRTGGHVSESPILNSMG